MAVRSDCAVCLDYSVHRGLFNEEMVMVWEIGKWNRKGLVFAAVCMMMLLAGCGERASEKTEGGSAQADDKTVIFDEKESVDAQIIAEILSDIYAEAVNKNTLGSLDTVRRMIARLGECGYTAADMENQIDMTGTERALAFCRAVTEKEVDHMAVIVFQGTGFQLYDLRTWDGHVNVDRAYYQYDQNGQLQKKNESGYLADLWQYTEEGYLFFGGSYFSDENYVLTLSDASEYTALRILPLSEACRELNRKYILPVGYGRNNMFLTDWSEEDFGSLDFYDVFDCFYPILHGQPHPYTANGGAETESVYEIPENIFENVVTAHVKIDQETLREKTAYLSEKAAYEYRPRGFYDSEYPDIPYPEVADYAENEDGTITLTVNAVYPAENTSKSFSHKTVIRPLGEGGFQYVSNEMISSGEGDAFWWHSDRLAEDNRKEIDGKDAAQEKVLETSSREIARTDMEEGEEKSDLWMIPRAKKSLLTEAEKEELKDSVLTAAEQAEEVYRDIELAGEAAYGSKIKVPKVME